MHTLNRFLTYFRHNPQEFYLYVLLAVFLAVLFINFPYNKSLIGWDNLLPELNFNSNIQRGLFSLWQENEGLGLIGGHGFASTLPHTVFQLILSVLLPINYLRPFFFLIMLLLGSVGAFFLSDILLPGIHTSKKGFASLSTGLFYMLNFATIQMFYIPLEAFAVHFAFLPWLLFLTISIFKKPKKKYFFWFTVISFTSSHQGFIPPLFLIYLIFLGILSLFYFFKYKSKNVFYIISGIFLITTITNAYWLFPIAFYTTNKSNIYLSSYNNITTTDDFLLKSIKFGDINSLITLKSFLVDAVDAFPQGENKIFYIFEPWKNHLNSYLYIIPSYLFFALILLGIFYSYKKRSFWLIAFTGIFALTFLFMASDVPGLSILSDILRNHVPIFKQAFRIAFTKFSTSLSLFYAIYLGVGIYFVLEAVSTRKKYLNTISALVTFALLITLGLPIFSGYFFYNRTKLTLPDNYRQLFEFLKKVDPNSRIADFPQFIPTGWLIYNWGYSGSGFLWYGLPQPILDRNFDVWNNYNENYYWEISQSIYSQNTAQFENTLRKYNVRYLLVDPSVIGYVSPKAVSLDKFMTLISNSNILKLINNYGSIQVYEVEDHDRFNNFVSIRNNLPIISPYTNWNNYDKAYEEYGDYISDNRQQITNNNKPIDIFYPFRSLFTGRTQEDIEFKIEDNNSYFSFKSTIPKEMIGSKLIIPSLDNDEINEINPIDFTQTEKSPQIYLDGELIPASPSGEISLNYITEGNLEIRVPKVNGYYSASLLPNTYPLIPISCDTFNTGIMNRQFINNMIQLNSIGSSNCLDLDLPNLSQRLGYLISVENQNIEGKSLLFSIVNKNSQRADLETYLTKKTNNLPAQAGKKQITANHFIQPPMEEFGRGYVLHFDNISIGRVKTVNNLGKITVNPIPYRFLTSLKVVNSNFVRDSSSQAPRNDSIQQVEHPNPSYYKIVLSQQKTTLSDGLLNFDGDLTRSSQMPALRTDISIPYKTENINSNEVYATKKSAEADSWTNLRTDASRSGLSSKMIAFNNSFVKGVDPRGVEPLRSDLRDPTPHRRGPTPHPEYQKYLSFVKPAYAQESNSDNTQQIPDNKNTTLILSQSFDEGWKAYEIRCQGSGIRYQIEEFLPFLFGKEIKDHVLVNNWENGWELENAQCTMKNAQCTIVIYYLPQLLEFAGLGLLPIPFIFLLFLKMKNHAA